MTIRLLSPRFAVWLFCAAAVPPLAVAGAAGASARPPPEARELGNLRRAITDLQASFGPRYPLGAEYLKRLNAVERAAASGDRAAAGKFRQLRREALLANPLLGFGRLLVVKRRVRGPLDFQHLGLPDNHRSNSMLPRTGHDNEIAVLSPVGPAGTLATLYRPEDGGYAGEVDLHWDADRMLLTKSDRESWKIWEIRIDGTGLRRISRAPPDVDCFDACYVPGGRIVFGSTAAYQSVPCWHGRQKVTNLYLMNADGTGMRQLCFDQDHDLHPCVLDNGQVLYHRWDYTGINHIFMRQLMVMNPDGTGQRAIYGSNSWFPNALYFPRPLPGGSGRIVCILSGYHGVPRMGQLVVVDPERGWHESDGIVQRISGRGDPVRPVVRDNLVDNDWPKFLHPYPLSDRYFLVSCSPRPGAPWGIYLADVFDNLVLVREEPGYALLEPVPLQAATEPPVLADRVDLSRKDGVVYLHDVYAGPGLEGVPRGTIKKLRVLAYHFGYMGLAGPDKVGYGGPWEVMRILGTVPLEEDGSALFRVPASTPVAVQALDGEGKAVQLMRSWFTAMPGETLSCVGCHESPADAAPVAPALAARREPREIDPWRGPPRGFDFTREVQPVLDKHCVKCHDGRSGRPDLRPRSEVPGYRGLPIQYVDRLDPKMREDTGGVLQYAPAYDALIAYIRRVGIEDDVSLLTPGEYHADTSELVQMLRKGHQGVRLDADDRDRIVTWIDLNAPCHGTWGEVYPIPARAHQRRMELRKLYGGPGEDPEVVPAVPAPSVRPVAPRTLPPANEVALAGWPLDAVRARELQEGAGARTRTVDLGGGVSMRLVRVPAGKFVMGDAAGEPDERPLARVAIEKPFWMGVLEVTNEQFLRFDPEHESRYYQKRHARADDRGMPLDLPEQPVVRVSWNEAMAFCRWLSARTGEVFRLPTEAEWEYACRAGTATPLSYGGAEADFSRRANVADRRFSRGYRKDGRQATGGLVHLVLEGAALSDKRFDDGAVVTAPAGSYLPNVWGLCDMHGNAAEWTLTAYRPYPYRRDDGRNDPRGNHRRVVRGGSFFDRPERCRSAFRLDYPAWRRVFNVGFRVVAAEPALTPAGRSSCGTCKGESPTDR